MTLARLLVACAASAIAVPAVAQGPPPPTKLWAAQTSLNGISLAWTLSPGATGYVLYRQAGNEGRAKLATLAGNVSRYGYTVRAASEKIQQFYLQSIGTDGPGADTVAFNPVTLVNAAVAAVPPASVKATESSPGVITVTWTSSAGATGYMLGRVVGGGGLAMLCALCSTQATYVDSGVANGIRYQYSVIAITPTAVSLRTMSNAVTPGVVATTTGGTSVPSGTAGTGGTAATSGTGGTGSSTGTTTTADTSRTTPTPTPTPTTPTPSDPLHGRYRVSLTGFTVQAQTYDNFLQIDGKGDEVYLATQVMQLDTASRLLVISNEVQTSKIYGDVNGFIYRIKAGTAGGTGGLANANDVPAPSGTSGFPMVLWEGELAQNRGAVVVVPTIWEWDDNAELFGNWVTGRFAFLARLLHPDGINAILRNTSLLPVEVGAAGLYVRTNMFGDARDRPVGLRPGSPLPNSGFFAPLDIKTVSSYGSMSNQVVGSILQNNPFVTMARALFTRLFGSGNSIFTKSLGTTNARLLQPSALNEGASAVGGVVGSSGKSIAQIMNQPGVGLQQFAQVIRSASPSSFSTDLYLFEKMIVITPDAVQASLGQGRTTGAVPLDVQYVDYGSLSGKYLLHLKVERIQ